jgi:hypothetical protein
MRMIDEGRICSSETKNVEKMDVMDQVRLELESGVCHGDVVYRKFRLTGSPEAVMGASSDSAQPML